MILYIDFLMDKIGILRIMSSFFERIDKNDYDGEYCVMEWYIPIKDTTNDRNGSF